MIAYLFLGLCLLAAVLLAARWFVNAEPKRIIKVLRYLVVGLAAAVGLFLMVTGRFAHGVPLMLLALMVWRRWRLPGVGGSFGGSRKPSSGRSSQVETMYLRMTLEHDTGVMQGTVLRGVFAGSELSALTLPQLIELLGDCHREDTESATLLETYLDRAIGGDWRQQAQADAASGAGRAGSRGSPQMTREEAYEILGVAPGASVDEVKDAYRTLMQKLHPDQGGSTYLAAKINQAKDILLGA